jgi:hypothetical protein
MLTSLVPLSVAQTSSRLPLRFYNSHWPLIFQVQKISVRGRARLPSALIICQAVLLPHLRSILVLANRSLLFPFVPIPSINKRSHLSLLCEITRQSFRGLPLLLKQTFTVVIIKEILHPSHYIRSQKLTHFSYHLIPFYSCPLHLS